MFNAHENVSCAFIFKIIEDERCRDNVKRRQPALTQVLRVYVTRIACICCKYDAPIEIPSPAPQIGGSPTKFISEPLREKIRIPEIDVRKRGFRECSVLVGVARRVATRRATPTNTEHSRNPRFRTSISGILIFSRSGSLMNLVGEPPIWGAGLGISIGASYLQHIHAIRVTYTRNTCVSAGCLRFTLSRHRSSSIILKMNAQLTFSCALNIF